MKIFELKLSDEAEAGVSAISLVESPATEEYFIAFNSDPEKLQKLVEFQAIDEAKHLVMGAAMIPNKQIYRKDGDEEFFVFFTEPTIRQIAEKFFLDGKINSTTFEHMDTLNGVTVVESWIVEDPIKDKSAVYGFSYPVGSWVISMKINNPEIWSRIQNQEIRGFSVEGVFANQLIKNQSQMDIEKLSESIAEKIKAIFAPEKPEEDPKKFAQVEAIAKADGSPVVILFEGEALEAGMALFFLEGEEQLPLPTGEYTLSTGETLIVAEDGILGEIVAATEEELEAQNALNQDEILTAVAALLEDFMGQLKAAQEEFTTAQLETFKKELKLPGSDPIRKDPDDPQKPVYKSLKAKIQERNSN